MRAPTATKQWSASVSVTRAPTTLLRCYLSTRIRNFGSAFGGRSPRASAQKLPFDHRVYDVLANRRVEHSSAEHCCPCRNKIVERAVYERLTVTTELSRDDWRGAVLQHAPLFDVGNHYVHCRIVQSNPRSRVYYQVHPSGRVRERVLLTLQRSHRTPCLPPPSIHIRHRPVSGNEARHARSAQTPPRKRTAGRHNNAQT
mmetsp:Transcript_4507/g.12280  ORF Transcript_4507/g.12280 Transcript_4507/m.12280 type:complete len:200 (-) Transcript_4507:88-687(-)